jgi:anti-sigma factor ChrR (cupin superfamily)
MANDAFLPLAEPYALGALEPEERAAFERHKAACPACQGAVASASRALSGVTEGLVPAPPRSSLRDELLDLAAAPVWPFDLASVDWQELGPGIRFNVLHEDAARGVRRCLVWATPGARMDTHRHGGDEAILVLKGALRDERGVYGPGALCRSRKGSVHSESVEGDEDCVCYVVYYGPLEFL